MARASGRMDAALRAGRLGPAALFFVGIAAVTPLSVVAAAVPLAYGQIHELGVPAGYTVVAVLLAVFVVGLAAMARHVPNSGAFYSYAAAGIGRPAGVAMGFVALAAYTAMETGLYGAFAIAARAAARLAGIDVYWGAWILAGWTAITVLGQLRITVNARILGILVAAEIVVVTVVDVVMVAHPAGGVIRYTTLNPALLADPTGAASLVGAVTGLVGFEIPLAFAPLARHPRTTVARAVQLILLAMLLLYAGSAWAMSVVTGPDRIIPTAAAHLSDLFFVLPAPYVPGVVVHLLTVLFATSLFAGISAFHSVVGRYYVTLGREGVVPAWLAATRKDDIPAVASAAQSLLTLLALMVVVAAGFDPTKDLFFYGTLTGGLGVLILITTAAIAVVRYFHRHRHGENLWRARIAPITAATFLTLVLALTVAFFGDLLGTTDLLGTWITPGAYVLIIAAGIGWAYHLRRTRPGVYQAIGTGDRRPTLPAQARHRSNDTPTATGSSRPAAGTRPH